MAESVYELGNQVATGLFFDYQQRTTMLVVIRSVVGTTSYVGGENKQQIGEAVSKFRVSIGEVSLVKRCDKISKVRRDSAYFAIAVIQNIAYASEVGEPGATEIRLGIIGMTLIPVCFLTRKTVRRF